MPTPILSSVEPSSPAADTQRTLSSNTSAQLSRWSRARALRSGRGLHRLKVPATTPLVSSSPLEGAGVVEAAEDGDEVALGGKTIYMVSDGTGCTLEQAVSAALGQFDHRLVDRASSVNTHLIFGVNDVDRMLDIIKQAAKEGALLLFTLADPSMSEPAKQACQLWRVPYVDVLRPMIDAIARHLGVEPSGIPRFERKIPLTEEYFRRMEAIEFTIDQDDGAQPQKLSGADIVLLGVSRSGKTPLSIYLSQKGYKVANVPIVMGVELPKTLFEIDQNKIYGLSINPVTLQSIRKARAQTIGLSCNMRSNYSEMDHVRQELDFASRIYAHNPLWPIIEVTGRAIEETAAVVLRIFHDRKQKI